MAPVQTKHTIQSVNAPVTNGQAPAGMVVLPKMNKLGKVMLTAIDPTAITGCQPTTISYNGKTYNGTKIYTKTGAFKVFADPQNVLLGTVAARQGQLITVDATVQIPAYTGATNKLPKLLSA